MLIHHSSYSAPTRYSRVHDRTYISWYCMQCDSNLCPFHTAPTSHHVTATLLYSTLLCSATFVFFSVANL